MTNTDCNVKIREHYGAIGLTDRIKAAVTTIAPENQVLTVAQLAPLDQFHKRGILGTAELAGAARLDVSTRVLDVGCGTGGPARYLAATFGNTVTGVDLSPSFIDAATYLTARCGLSDRVRFQVGDALHLPFDDASFDAVFLQQRGDEHRGPHRPLCGDASNLGPERPVRHLRSGESRRRCGVPGPMGARRLGELSLTENETRTALEEAWYRAVLCRDDTEVSLDWFKTVIGALRQSGPNLGLVMGPHFQAMTSNLARNFRENRLGVLSAVLIPH